MSSFSLYVHIPYCVHKCPYCDFNTYAVSSIPEREYVAALLAELDYRATLPEWSGKVIKTIYFGGGTPSLFSPAAIQRFISGVVGLFPIDERVEISLEANPGAIAEDALHGFREAGVNRLSFGSQSFSSHVLKNLGRQHTPAQIESSVANARRAGFHNINLDIIYGAPEQTVNDLKFDLTEAVKLDPEHVSAYGLTIEKGTPFFTSYKKGTLKLPKEQHVIEMIEELNGFLDLCGLRRYEISNFAKPGLHARHNMAYWDGADYLGLGAGAHSFNHAIPGGDDQSSAVRWSNFALPAKYIKETIANGHGESWRETLALPDAVFEFFFLGLRKIKGVSIAECSARFGFTPAQLYPARMEMLSVQGLIETKGDLVALTERGLMLADSVIEEFITPEIQLTSVNLKSAPIIANEMPPISVNF